MGFIKNKVRDAYILSVLIRKNKSGYRNYYGGYRHFIYSALKEKGINHIKPIQRDQWKLSYKCCYFQGQLEQNGQRIPVFIKVLGDRLEDCRVNETAVNQHLEENSLWVAERKPKVYFSFVNKSVGFMVFDYLSFAPLANTEESAAKIKELVIKLSDAGVIHTDFSYCNFGEIDGRIIVFDFGTSLCPGSDNVRIRNGENYNHLDQITEEAKRIFENPDFYYDDAVHCGLSMDRSCLGFIVGQKDEYAVKLGDTVYYYQVKYLVEDNNLPILVKATPHN